MFKSRYNLPSWALNFHNDFKFISQSSLYKKERNAFFSILNRVRQLVI